MVQDSGKKAVGFSVGSSSALEGQSSAELLLGELARLPLCVLTMSSALQPILHDGG